MNGLLAHCTTSNLEERGNFISEIPSPRWLPTRANEIHLPVFEFRVSLISKLPTKAHEVHLPLSSHKQ